MARVAEGIQTHALAGGWTSAGGDHLLIGCNGAFNSDRTEVTVTMLPAQSRESGAHISEVGEHHFAVSHFPLPTSRYDVDEWPHLDEQGRATMHADGQRWIRTHDLRCD
jgi:hypothetical protein